MTPDLFVSPSDKNGSAPAADYPPPSRKIAMLFSGTCKRAISPDRGPPQRERDYASDTRLGNRARVSKPIEITARGVFVCHQRGRKHPSCVRLAPRRDADNLERPRWFFARVQGELLPPAHPQRLERPTSYGGHVIRGARVCFCLMLFVNCCTLSLELLNYHPVRGKTAST